MRLHKLHATGNDFLVVAAPGPPPAAVAALCDRHRGVGADGLMILGPGDADVDCTMTLYNADGSAAEMSGNGIRCLAWVAVDAGRARGDHLVVGTAAGTRTLDLDRDPATGALRSATVDMGPVTFDPGRIPLDAPTALDLNVTYHGVTYHGDAAGIGNPHLVLFVDDVEHARVTQHGPHLEHDPRFPNGTNVEFVEPAGPDDLRMRVWERGVGETLSCGTGACATAAAAHRRGLVGTQVTVHVPGGDLSVHLDDTTRLGGPVQHIFDVDLEGVDA